jgi:hypothetical protein
MKGKKRTTQEPPTEAEAKPSKENNGMLGWY